MWAGAGIQGGSTLPPPSSPPLKEPGSLPGKNNNIVIWGSLQSVFQCILSDQARDFSHEDGRFI